VLVTIFLRKITKQDDAEEEFYAPASADELCPSTTEEIAQAAQGFSGF